MLVWLKANKKVIFTIFAFIFWEFPQWFQSVWLNEPFAAWFQKHLWPMMHFSSVWITTPIWLALIVWVYRSERRQAKQAQALSIADQVRIVGTVEYHKGPVTGGYWKPYCPKCHLPLAVSPAYESNTVFCVNKNCDLYHVETTAEEIDEAIARLAGQDT